MKLDTGKRKETDTAMLENPAYNENGEKILCEMNGKNAEMLMNIKVKRMEKGEKITLLDSENETAVLLLCGKVSFTHDGVTDTTDFRESPFQKTPYALHFCRGTGVEIEALEKSKIIIQQTDNERRFDTVYYTPEKCLYQEFGGTQWEGTGHRTCATMFDLSNAPYSNLVLGEVFHHPGRWSSYPPHYHPQPEVYYYQFDYPQGFGAAFMGDDVQKSTHGSFECIIPNNAHQQVCAPGYTMYYVWMIRHLDGDPWDKTRIYEKEHEWLANAD